jgi:hypothetical protein
MMTTMTTKMATRNKADKNAVPPCRPWGPAGRVRRLGSSVHPCMILSLPPRGGGALSSSKGGGVRVSIARPLTPSSPSATANKDNKNNYDEHKGKRDGNECKDSCLGILHIVPNRGHARGKPWTPEEVDAIQRLHSRFRGNRWYSDWAPPMPSMINRWPKGNTAKSLRSISCRG